MFDRESTPSLELKFSLIPQRIGMMTELDRDNERRRAVEVGLSKVFSRYERALNEPEPPKGQTIRTKTGRMEATRPSTDWHVWKTNQEQALSMVKVWEDIIFGHRQPIVCRLGDRVVRMIDVLGNRAMEHQLTKVEFGYQNSEVVMGLTKSNDNGKTEISLLRRIQTGKQKWTDNPFMVFVKEKTDGEETMTIKFQLSDASGEWQEVTVEGRGVFSALSHALFWSQTMPLVSLAPLRNDAGGGEQVTITRSPMR